MPPELFTVIFGRQKRYEMKKILLATVALCLTMASVNAQDLFIRGGVGYAVPQSGQLYNPVYTISNRAFYPINGNYTIVEDPSNSSESFSAKNASYSAGVQGVVAMGIMVTKNIGVELSANLGLATRKQTTSIDYKDPLVTQTLDIEQQSKLPILVSPALVIESGGKVNVYARAGITIPAKTKIEQTASFIEQSFDPQTNVTTTRTVNVSEDYFLTLSPGFNGAVGAKFNIGEGIFLFGEVSLLSMNLMYKESEITDFVQDGRSVLSLLQPQDRTTQYKVDGTSSGNNNIAPTTSVPFSNVGINVGISIDLFEKTEDKK